MKKYETLLKALPGGKWGESKYSLVTPSRAKSYINSIVPKKKVGRHFDELKQEWVDDLAKCKLKEYCENCGRRFGEKFKFKKPVMYKTYFVCPDCAKDLSEEMETGKQLSVPNLNDL